MTLAKLSKNVKKQLIRLLILFLIFLAALAGYFVWSMQNVEAEYTIYTSMDEPKLPVVYVVQQGQEINVMHGYRQDMGNAASTDSITVLPEDRQLELRIAEYGNTVTGLSYEIRSLDLDHFVERTEVKDIRSTEGSSYVTLPIQNLIDRDEQYLLRISLDIGEESVNYYTKIIWTEDEYIGGMTAFALDFSRRTFDYDAARELATYIETSDTADNSSFGDTGIDSSFSNLTWGSMDMVMETEPMLTVREYDGIMSAIEVTYQARRQGEADTVEHFMVKDAYTLRQGSERIYLMNYERTVDQIFDGSKYLFSGKRIDLGINSAGSLQDMRSAGGQYIAFKTNRELWCYDQEERVAVSVFSFRSGSDDGVRSNYGAHDIKILSLEDSGRLDFVVYGYMNRGVHEGYNGIAYYSYDIQNDILTELFFMPVRQTYGRISLEVGELCKKGGNDMFYIKQEDAVVAIDLNSLEMVTIASGLRHGTYAVNDLQTGFAWQDGDTYHSERIRLLDIESGTTRTIDQHEDEYLRVLDFTNNDLIIGRTRSSDIFSLNGTVRALPMYSIEILNSSLGLEKEYSRESIYIDEVTVEGSRIKLTLFRKSDDGTDYEFYGEDTIVSTEAPFSEQSSLVSYNDTVKKKVTYVSLDNEIRTTRSLTVRAPEQISYESSGTVEIDKAQSSADQMIFSAYANGRLVLRSPRLTEAVEASYEEMGYVTDADGSIVFNRTDRTEVVNIANPVQTAYQLMVELRDFGGNRISEEGGLTVLDTYGLNLNQLLYYVYKGIPAAVNTGEDSYCLIYGYDNKNVRIYLPEALDESQSQVTLSREEAESWLRQLNYSSVCALEH